MFQPCLLFSFTGDGLKYFINEKEGGSMLQGEQLSDVSGKEFNDLRISKANSNNLVEEMLPLKFDQLVTWSRVLQPYEITMAFDQGRFWNTSLVMAFHWTVTSFLLTKDAQNSSEHSKTVVCRWRETIKWRTARQSTRYAGYALWEKGVGCPLDG